MSDKRLRKKLAEYREDNRRTQNLRSYGVQWRFVDPRSVRAGPRVDFSSWRWLSRGRREKVGDVNYKALIGNSFLHSVSLYPSDVKRTGEGDVRRIEGEYPGTLLLSSLYSSFPIVPLSLCLLFHPHLVHQGSIYIFFAVMRALSVIFLTASTYAAPCVNHVWYTCTRMQSWLAIPRYPLQDNVQGNVQGCDKVALLLRA